jgi:hypothetical protein
VVAALTTQLVVVEYVTEDLIDLIKGFHWKVDVTGAGEGIAGRGAATDLRVDACGGSLGARLKSEPSVLTVLISEVGSDISCPPDRMTARIALPRD